MHTKFKGLMRYQDYPSYLQRTMDNVQVSIEGTVNFFV